MKLSRRDLLAGAAAFALWPQKVSAAPTDHTEAMLTLLPDRNAAARLGADWVGHEQKEPAAILQSLQQRLRWSPDADAATVHRNLANAIGSDFRTGDIVAVEGWQIARTQAELCALAYFATTGSL